MKKSLTKQMIKRYIDNGGDCCPYCGSNNLGYVSVDLKSKTCHYCDKRWRDTFILTGFEEIK